MSYIIFVALSMMWGSNFILMKKATLWFDPVTVGGLRIAGAVLFLGAVRMARQREWPLSRDHFWPLLFVAALGYAFPFALQPILIERCGSGFIGMMVSFVPLMTIIVSVPMLGVYPTPRQLLGVVGGLAFLLLIMADGLDREISATDFLLALCVPLVYAVCNTFIKRRFVGIEPLPLALASLGLALLLFLPYVTAFPYREAAAREDLPLALASITILGVLGTGFGAYAFTKLLQDHGPLFAGMVAYLIPSFALVWGWIDNETVTSRQVVALMGVLVMVALVQMGPVAGAIVASPGKDD